MSYTSESPRPIPKDLDPFRILFPIGAALAVAGTGLWPLAALGWIPYPGPVHSSLMIQGFELSFIMGFLLTAFPRFTRTEPCRPIELLVAAIAAIGFGAAALLGVNAIAQGFFLVSMLVLIAVIGRRFFQRQNDPPEEALFIAVALLLGLVGSVFSFATAMGLQIEPIPRFGLRLIAQGMVLSLVLGVGALLVPVFIGIRDPLAIPRIAKPHERPRRRILYLALGALLTLSFVAEALFQTGLAAWLRALVAAVMGLLVWKLHRIPKHRTVTGIGLWASGWFVMLGLWGAAFLPLYAVGALHLTFIGGFGLLTLGIGTRVLITHGGHSPDSESKVLTPAVIAAIVLAILFRILAETNTAQAMLFYALSGGLWSVGWIAWAARALPRMIHR